jgi:hypothetical protein
MPSFSHTLITIVASSLYMALGLIQMKPGLKMYTEELAKLQDGSAGLMPQICFLNQFNPGV